MILEASDFRNQHHINTTLRSKHRLHSGHACKGYEMHTLYKISFGKSIEVLQRLWSRFSLLRPLGKIGRN